jgi:hypothetical protein
VQNSFPRGIQDTEVHFVGVQIYSTVMLVLFCIKSHVMTSRVELIKARYLILPKMVCEQQWGLHYYQFIQPDPRARAIFRGFSNIVLRSELVASPWVGGLILAIGWTVSGAPPHPRSSLSAAVALRSNTLTGSAHAPPINAFEPTALHDIFTSKLAKIPAMLAAQQLPLCF